MSSSPEPSSSSTWLITICYLRLRPWSWEAGTRHDKLYLRCGMHQALFCTGLLALCATRMQHSLPSELQTQASTPDPAQHADSSYRDMQAISTPGSRVHLSIPQGDDALIVAGNQLALLLSTPSQAGQLGPGDQLSGWPLDLPLHHVFVAARIVTRPSVLILPDTAMRAKRPPKLTAHEQAWCCVLFAAVIGAEVQLAS